MNIKTIVVLLSVYTISIISCTILIIDKINKDKVVKLAKKSKEPIVIIEKKDIEVFEEKNKFNVIGNHVFLETSFFTPLLGSVIIKNDINIEDFKRNHQISIGVLSLINSQSLLANLGYSYKSFGFDLYGGYSFKLKDYDIGFGIKYIYKL